MRSSNVFQLLADEWLSGHSSANRVESLILHWALQGRFYNSGEKPSHSVLIRDDDGV